MCRLAVVECCSAPLNLLKVFTQKASHFLPHQCKCLHQYGSSSSSFSSSCLPLRRLWAEAFTPLWHKQSVSTDLVSGASPRRDAERPFCFLFIIQAGGKINHERTWTLALLPVSSQSVRTVQCVLCFVHITSTFLQHVPGYIWAHFLVRRWRGDAYSALLETDQPTNRLSLDIL